ncbi:MAG: hypothetical protein QOC66_2290 [Pseudonocardiales bacterium]|nr:hypothetical protein [Pseudonocardiales bacterium]
MAEWQTRTVQVRVSERTWGFNSPLAHQILLLDALRTVRHMLVTNHVLSGAVVGLYVRRPVVSFLLGTASHFALDSVPHYGLDEPDHDRFMRIAVRDGITGLAALWAIAATTRGQTRVAALAGAAGAALPDLDKPFRELTGRELWPAVVNDFHGRIQSEAESRLPREFAVAAAAAATLVVLLRKRGRSAAV